MNIEGNIEYGVPPLLARPKDVIEVPVEWVAPGIVAGIALLIVSFALIGIWSMNHGERQYQLGKRHGETIGRHGRQ